MKQSENIELQSVRRQPDEIARSFDQSDAALSKFQSEVRMQTLVISFMSHLLLLDACKVLEREPVLCERLRELLHPDPRLHRHLLLLFVNSHNLQATSYRE